MICGSTNITKIVFKSLFNRNNFVELIDSHVIIKVKWLKEKGKKEYQFGTCLTNAL